MDVPAIIDKHDYAAAQAKLVENADVARGTGERRHYLLRELYSAATAAALWWELPATAKAAGFIPV